MNYYKITLTRRGKRSYEVLKARSKISAIRQAKQEFKGFNVVKAEETSPDMASRVMDILDGIKSSFKPKIDISYKIASFVR